MSGNENGNVRDNAGLLHEKGTISSGDLDKTTKTGKNEGLKYKKVPQSDENNCKNVTYKTNDDDKRMQDWKLIPPDGGWGWLVLLGATLVNILIPGTIKSFGVLFVEFLEVFEAPQSAAAWIPALCYFLYSSLGPVSSILSLKYSYRSVSLIGGTFAAVGMILSFFADSVAFLCVTYGVLVGIGAGLSFPPTVYIVTSYFVRLRGLANGLCISGSSIGSIILPPVLRILLELYGYRGAVLLMGGVTLNVWVASLFYDPVEKHMKRQPLADSQPNDREDETNSFLQQDSNNDSVWESQDLASNNFNRSASSAAMQNYIKAQVTRERKISVPTSHTEVMRARSGTQGSPNVNSSSALHAVPETNDLKIMMTSQTKLGVNRRRVPGRSPSTSSFQYISTAYHGSTLTLQPETFASSFSLKKKGSEKITDMKKVNFFDLSLLKDPLYLIILISNSTNAISYVNFIILLPSYALSLGYDKTMGAYLLSVVSALDLIGRIGGSALSDLPLMPKEWYFIGGLFVSGVSLSLMAFVQNYYIICLYCAIFGLASGIYVGITAVIMADMLGTDRIQSTYGISLFVNGILQLIGPPICGLWFEETKNYVSLFCTLGIILIVGASLWGFLPFIKKKVPEVTD